MFFFGAESKAGDFWDRCEVGVLGGPVFPGGDEGDLLSTGFYVGLDARYQLFTFMAVGISFGTQSWSGEQSFDDLFTPMGESNEISSNKTNVGLSFHFGPSAPTWTNIVSGKADIHDVKPYTPGMKVPFFVFDIGPYFWSWESGGYDETGSDLMIRGTFAGFYQMTELISLTLGLSYTMYHFRLF
jgi:hypothetical protein